MPHCIGKIRHTEEAARKAARRLGIELGVKFDAYKCTLCRWWHIGHAMSRQSSEALMKQRNRGKVCV